MSRLGVVIVNYNGAGYVADSLRSLRASAVPPAAVVVVDNASSDGSPDLIGREFPDVRLFRSPTNVGFPAGANLGVARCLEEGCDALLLLNPDAVVTPPAIGALLDGLGRHPRALLVPAIGHADRPRVGDSYAGPVSWWRGRMGAPWLNRPAGELPTAETRVETASFCCVLMPAAAAREIGPLDEDYFLYFEDADYLARAARAGYEVWYVPAASVLHRESSATGGGGSPLALYYYTRNRHRFVRKFRRGRPVYVLFCAYAVLDVIGRAAWGLLRGRPSLALAFLRGGVHGWTGRAGRTYDRACPPSP